MKKIFWLASYPKSGNTWMRIFLSNYVMDGDKPVNINDLFSNRIASSRTLFDEYSGINAAEMDMEMVDRYRPEVYRFFASEQEEDPLFMKVHDSWHLNLDGEALFPADISRGVIYLIRNPLDVAVSFSDHEGKTVQKIIRNMNDPDFAFHYSPFYLGNQLRQKMGSWSRHFLSWTKQKEIPCLVVRYEDMHLQPEETFSKVINFCGLEFNKTRMQKAIRFSSFDEVKSQENESGFSEKSYLQKSFFRNGKTGSWRSVISAEDQQSLIMNHKQIMFENGYLTPEGEPIF